jgi:hypothetical protein
LVRAANMVRGLVAGLLMLVALVAVAGAGSTKAFSDAASVPLSQSIIAPPQEQAAAVHEVVSADRETERPCGRNGIVPGTARCPTVQCITVCGGLLAATFAIPPPSASADEHASLIDDPSRGISTIPDLPPPRPSA